MSLVNKIALVLLVIAGFIAAGFIGCAVGTSAGKHLANENERIAGLLAVRDADLKQARGTIQSIRESLGSIGRGIDSVVARAGSIKGTNEKLRAILEGYRSTAESVADLERWLNSGNHQAK